MQLCIIWHYLIAKISVVDVVRSIENRVVIATYIGILLEEWIFSIKEVRLPEILTVIFVHPFIFVYIFNF